MPQSTDSPPCIENIKRIWQLPSPLGGRSLAYFFSIVVAVFLASSCGLAIWQFFARQYDTAFDSLHPAIRFLLSFALALLLAGMAHRLVPLRFGSFGQKKPIPTWVALIAGLLLTAIADRCHMLGDETNRPPASGLLVIFLAAYSSVAVLSYLNRPEKPPAVRPTQLGIADLGWSALESWIRSDSPSTFDLFNHMPAKNRLLAQILSEPPTQRTIGLVGDFGTGKSSILDWLAQDLSQNQNDRIHITRISCWGFSNADAAVECILSEAIETLSEAIDTFSIRHVPESYRESLSATHKWFPNLTGLLLGDSDPADHLDRLAPLLAQTNARLLLILEDLDRNQNPAFDVSAVVALLDKLKSHTNISFILTGRPSPQSKIDFAKICDHIEIVPPVNDESILTLVLRVRDHILNDDSWFDPVDSNQRNEIGTIWKHLPYQDAASSTIAVGRACCSLAGPPRVLKHALRHALLTWTALRGEIDPDHLLVASILRYGSERTLWFMMSYRHVLLKKDEPHELLSLPDSEKQAEPSTTDEFVLDKWKQLAEDRECDYEAARRLVCYLWPSSRSLLAPKSDWITIKSIQGMQQRHPIDYWKRYIAGSEFPNECSDQEMIRLIREWKRDGLLLLAEVLVNRPEASITLGHFCKMLGGRDFLPLYSEVFRLSLAKHAAATNDKLPGIEVLRFYASKYIQADARKMLWVFEEAEKAVSVSVLFAHQLVADWVVPTMPFIDFEALPACRDRFLKASQKKLATADLVMNALDGQYPYALRWFIVPPGATLPSTESAWSWIGPILIECLKQGSVLAFEQVGHLIADGDTKGFRLPDGERGTKLVYQLSKERIGVLFGERQKEMLDLWLTPPVVDSPDVAYLFESIKAACPEMLRELLATSRPV